MVFSVKVTLKNNPQKFRRRLMLKLQILLLTILVFATFFKTFTLMAFQLPDTGQKSCYNNTGEIPCPNQGEPFYGQDAQYQGYNPTYQDNGDGTVTDLNTGLIWQQGDAHNRASRTWQEACDYCTNMDLAGNSDWRVPYRRELISLI